MCYTFIGRGKGNLKGSITRGASMIDKEKALLIEMMSNVDDIKKELTAEQLKKLERCFLKINGNYNNLLEGVK
jgi:hypothetical protein